MTPAMATASHRRCVGEDAPAERGERAGCSAAHADDTHDATAQPSRVHRAPQPKVEGRAERQAQPEDDGDRDHDRRGRHHEEDEQRCRPHPTRHCQLHGAAGADSAGERSEEVRDERRRGQGRQSERLETVAPRDRRKQRTDERHRHAHADRRDEVEGEIPPDSATRRGRQERWPDHRVPRSSPSGLRGELSGSAWVRRRGCSAICPEGSGPPPSMRRFGHEKPIKDLAGGRWPLRVHNRRPEVTLASIPGAVSVP